MFGAGNYSQPLFNDPQDVSTSASPTFAGLSLAEAGNVALGTTTGSKIGTGATQKLGFWNAAPVVQAAAIAADGGGAVACLASGATTLQVKLDALLLACRNAGIIAT